MPPSWETAYALPLTRKPSRRPANRFFQSVILVVSIGCSTPAAAMRGVSRTHSSTTSDLKPARSLATASSLFAKAAVSSLMPGLALRKPFSTFLSRVSSNANSWTVPVAAVGEVEPRPLASATPSAATATMLSARNELSSALRPFMVHPFGEACRGHRRRCRVLGGGERTQLSVDSQPSRSTSRAALRPLAPVTPPPGWVPDPHRKKPATGVR